MKKKVREININISVVQLWCAIVFFALQLSLNAQVALPPSQSYSEIYYGKLIALDKFGSSSYFDDGVLSVEVATGEDDSFGDLSTQFTLTDKNAIISNATISASCSKSFYIQSIYTDPVKVQIAVKGLIKMEYSSDLKDSDGYRSYHESGNLTGGLFCSIFGVDNYKNGVEFGGWGFPGVNRIDTQIEVNSGVPFNLSVDYPLNAITNRVFSPNQTGGIEIKMAFSLNDGGISTPMWKSRKYSASGFLAVELSLVDGGVRGDKIIMNSTRPELSFERVGNGVVVKYTGVLQGADSLKGPYVDLPNAKSPYTETTGSTRFFRARF